MRVLLTGAGGFVGGHLALGLARLGFSLLLNDRSFDDEALARLGGLERLTCDVLELEMHLAATGAPAPDVLIHGAAVTANPAERGLGAADALQEDVALNLKAFALAQRLGVKRFILLSSAGVFSAAVPAPLDELVPPDALGGYATAKRAGELAAASLRRAGAVDAVTVRLGNLYGPFEQARPTRPRVSLVGRTVAEATGRITVDHPEAAREWTFAPDLAPGLAHLLTHPAPPDMLHLCAPEVLTDSELAWRLTALLPGTRVEPRPAAEPVPVRPPLTSCFPELHPRWTPLAVGLPLALGLAAEAVPT